MNTTEKKAAAFCCVWAAISAAMGWMNVAGYILGWWMDKPDMTGLWICGGFASALVFLAIAYSARYED